MFAGFLVVILVEPPEQVLKDGPHGVVVQPGQSDLSVVVQDGVGAEVHCLGQEPFNEGVECAAGREAGYLVSELEHFQDLLDVWREPIQVGVEVISELLLGGGVPEVPQGKRRGVEELLSCRLLEGPCLVRDVLFVQPLLFFKDLLLGGFEHGVEPADDGHGKYHVAVLSPDKEVSKNAVGDVPDEVGDGGELAVLQGLFLSFLPGFLSREVCILLKGLLLHYALTRKILSLADDSIPVPIPCTRDHRLRETLSSALASLHPLLPGCCGLLARPVDGTLRLVRRLRLMHPRRSL